MSNIERIKELALLLRCESMCGEEALNCTKQDSCPFYQRTELTEYFFKFARQIDKYYCQLFSQEDKLSFNTRCWGCPDLHFDIYYSFPHPEKHIWRCGVLGIELIKDNHGVHKHPNCPRLQFPQPLDDKDLENSQ